MPLLRRCLLSFFFLVSPNRTKGKPRFTEQRSRCLHEGEDSAYVNVCNLNLDLSSEPPLASSGTSLLTP